MRQRADFDSEAYTKIDDIAVPGIFPGRAEVFRHNETGDVFQATPRQYRQSHWAGEADREIGEWQVYGAVAVPDVEPDSPIEPGPEPEPEPTDPETDPETQDP